MIFHISVLLLLGGLRPVNVVLPRAHMATDGSIHGKNEQGRPFSVRLAGIVSPSSKALRRQEIRIANYVIGDAPATAHMVPNGQAVMLVQPSQSDPGSHLRVLNYLLVREGLARLGDVHNLAQPEAEELRAGEQLARSERIGIWSIGAK